MILLQTDSGAGSGYSSLIFLALLVAMFYFLLIRPQRTRAKKQSEMAASLMVGDRVLGVVATYHPENDYVYSSDDLEILQAMANQAAIALENSRMFNRVETLVEFVQGITSGTLVGGQQVLEEEQVLELIHEQISQFTHYFRRFVRIDVHVICNDVESSEVSIWDLFWGFTSVPTAPRWSRRS